MVEKRIDLKFQLFYILINAVKFLFFQQPDLRFRHSVLFEARILSVLCLQNPRNCVHAAGKTQGQGSSAEENSKRSWADNYGKTLSRRQEGLINNNQ